MIDRHTDRYGIIIKMGSINTGGYHINTFDVVGTTLGTYFYWFYLPDKISLHIGVVVSRRHDNDFLFRQHMLTNMASIHSMVPSHPYRFLKTEINFIWFLVGIITTMYLLLIFNWNGNICYRSIINITLITWNMIPKKEVSVTIAQ